MDGKKETDEEAVLFRKEGIMRETIDYYNANVKKFFDDTASVNFTCIQNTFLKLLPKRATILDFGCGILAGIQNISLEQGCIVEAVDGSLAVCEAASKYTGIRVKQMLFQELNEKEIYDGIWACASILHVKRRELPEIIRKMSEATKVNGVIYLSFKYGDFEGREAADILRI